MTSKHLILVAGNMKNNTSSFPFQKKVCNMKVLNTDVKSS